ncbi:DUF3037 domain-containing protein [Dyadobacter aurulentus]|uniref:DUF3037 domain-containing protein n=1 Tax=Dyadobacter sp. UC 10 TaxID=2605428 RepID=UPI0011F0F19C|nr:DUF3037 domain-containing protein [Dyadobacter sp. UC 10]KAA0992953.1 DUF3037 domain-containing protein [Dyadobacter sp. UC 10]
MKKYQYQIIQYLHDRVTGEFINVGVIVYAPEHKFLGCKVISKYGRITSFFPGSNGKGILKSLRHFEKEIARAKQQFSELFPVSDDLAEITREILPNDDSSLTLTEVKKGIDLDFNKSLADLYRLLVTKWQSETDESATSDADVWNKKYKKYFDQYEITSRFTEFEVETKHDHFQFDKAWKNEIWHCYVPLSFDLQKEENVKSKVYKWFGKLNELATSEEKIDITLLTSIPRKHQNLDSFIYDKLLAPSDKLLINIVSEADAEALVQQISNDLQKHDLN